ncbi:MAG: efflux RND transporter periplasmic adaptor subunit, partial [Planctomycetaceae bacterium]|nr:efflux RND transporter periplasmic adaptor subunit [Planctomycetaceae bacterium]
MKANENTPPTPISEKAAESSPPKPRQNSAAKPDWDRREARRWWIKLFLQPLLFLVCGALLIVGLGWAQSRGWISAGGGGHDHASAGNISTRYICPMMCTSPQSEPGRCPVCAMELVQASANAGQGGSTSIQIDPVARRVANIETVAVSYMPMSQTVRVIGKLQYDEGTLKTLSAYVDGRLEKLYADYTGVVVQKGDHLALVYSPELYSGQVEMLLARKA